MKKIAQQLVFVLFFAIQATVFASIPVDTEQQIAEEAPPETISCKEQECIFVGAEIVGKGVVSFNWHTGKLYGSFECKWTKCFVPLLPGTTLTLTAIPSNAQYFFDGWSRDGCKLNDLNQCVITIILQSGDKDQEITARFMLRNLNEEPSNEPPPPYPTETP